MIEPITGVEVPDQFLLSARHRYGGRRSHPIGRVVLVSQVWGIAAARRNSAAIVRHLLESARISCIASGDHDGGATFARPPVLATRRERSRLAESSAAALDEGVTDLAAHLASAFDPTVPIIGIGSAEELSSAQESRILRIQGLGDVAASSAASLRDIGMNMGIRVQDWTHRPGENATLHDPDPLLPVLDCLSARLDALRRELQPQLVKRIEDLWYGVRPRQDLHQLLRLAHEAGIDLAARPPLQGMLRLVLAEMAPGAQLAREQQWLRSNVVRRLQAAMQGAPHHVVRLFDRELRAEYMRSLANPYHRWSMDLDRPLDAAFERLAHRAAGTIRSAILAGRAPSVAGARELLNIAAVLGFDDRKYALFRDLVGAQDFAEQCGSNAEEILNEIPRLIGALFANQEPRVRDLHRLTRTRALLQGLIGESLPPSDVREVLRTKPTLSRFAAELAALGAGVTPEETEYARRVDEVCIGPALVYSELIQRQAAVMAENLRAVMVGPGMDIAIVLCGGFHTQLLADELDGFSWSVLTPQVSQVGRREYALSAADLEKMLGKVGPRMRIRVMDENTASLGLRSAGRDWARGRQTVALASILVAAEGGYEPSTRQQCRVCLRTYDRNAGQVFVRWDARPPLVAFCSECGEHVCAWCAGFEAIPRLPGQGGIHIKHAGQIGRLICNIHGCPLGSSSSAGPRHIGGWLPGHAWRG